MTESDNSDRSMSDDPTADASDEWDQVVQRYYDPELDEELTTAITFAVAAAGDREPSELDAPPLYESIDVSALEATLFGAGREARPRGTVGVVEFEYIGYLVTVSSDGWVLVYESTTTVGGSP